MCACVVGEVGDGFVLWEVVVFVCLHGVFLGPSLGLGCLEKDYDWLPSFLHSL